MHTDWQSQLPFNDFAAGQGFAVTICAADAADAALKRQRLVAQLTRSYRAHTLPSYRDWFETTQCTLRFGCGCCGDYDGYRFAARLPYRPVREHIALPKSVRDFLDDHEFAADDDYYSCSECDYSLAAMRLAGVALTVPGLREWKSRDRWDAENRRRYQLVADSATLTPTAHDTAVMRFATHALVQPVHITEQIRRPIDDTLARGELDCLSFAYDGRAVYTTARGVRSLNTLTNFSSAASLDAHLKPSPQSFLLDVPRALQPLQHGFRLVYFDGDCTCAAPAPRCDVVLPEAAILKLSATADLCESQR